MDIAWVWQEFSIAANEIFSVSHGEVYTITPARPCEACLCHATEEQLLFLWSGLEGMFAAMKEIQVSLLAPVWLVICKSRSITIAVIGFKLNELEKWTSCSLLP